MDIIGILAFSFLAFIAFVAAISFFEKEQSIIPQQYISTVVAVLMVLGFLGYFAYQFLSITYSKSTNNGYITYNFCDEWTYEGRDPDSGNPIRECYNYSLKTSPVDEYIRNNIRGWLAPGLISGVITNIAALIVFNRMTAQKNDHS